MRQISSFAFTILITVHAMAFSLSEFGISMNGDEIKEKIKTISENCKKGGDKDACRESKKDIVLSGIKLPNIKTK